MLSALEFLSEEWMALLEYLTKKVNRNIHKVTKGVCCLAQNTAEW